jgi:hypothetical protein
VTDRKSRSSSKLASLTLYVLAVPHVNLTAPMDFMRPP